MKVECFPEKKGDMQTDGVLPLHYGLVQMVDKIDATHGNAAKDKKRSIWNGFREVQWKRHTNNKGVLN